ncbi:hypothetical protein [Herminiimonas arsenitoxidans]|uniref:hypothetical protein n=1 Tax=Herminiimonas arsenitoxidans TaxID=1809410 RepID=UPI000970A1C5|nr:hypothetical protein [Herminiimonas arsenitoxidans]
MSNACYPQHRAPIELKIVSKLVPPDSPIGRLSVFSDLIWDQTDLVESRTLIKGAKVNWQSIFSNVWETHYLIAISIMEYSYARLYHPIGENYACDMKTVQHEARYLALFVEYLQSRKIFEGANISHHDIQDYVSWLINRRGQALGKRIKTEAADLDWVDVRIRALQSYYSYNKRVSQPLLISPLHGHSIFKYLGKKRQGTEENRTPLIPKDVWDRFLCAALDYVEYFSDDILAGQSVIENIRKNVLPVASKAKNFAANNFTTREVKPILNAIVDFSINPNSGIAWRKTWANVEDLRFELFTLYEACLVVVSCLSGIRESELALIQVHGFQEQTDVDGVSKRYTVISRMVKGDIDRQLIWEVNRPVYQACHIIKKITSYARSHRDCNELFIRSWYRGAGEQFQSDLRKDSLGRSTKGSILPLGPDAMSLALKKFGARLDVAIQGAYQLPLVDGKKWNFTMRQPRRTLASRIAREPFGLIAGMLHYKHVKLTTFLGYAGKDESWIRDLAIEEFSANEEFLAQIWDDIQEGALAGARGNELLNEFKGVAGDLKKNSLQYFIENNRRNLHVGLLNYCLFQRDRALCLSNTKSDLPDKPVINACYPERCANSCISKNHLPIWQAQINDAQAMLNHKNVSMPQKIALKDDIAKSLRILNQLNGTS